jgi:hypothetical protein
MVMVAAPLAVVIAGSDSSAGHRQGANAGRTREPTRDRPTRLYSVSVLLRNIAKGSDLDGFPLCASGPEPKLEIVGDAFQYLVGVRVV